MLSRARTIWIACQALMAVCALRIFDIVLLKRYLDAPLVVLLWVAAPLALLLIARRAARAIEPASRSFLQRRVAALDAPAIALIAFGLLLLFGQHWGYQRAASDGREYFVQLRSLYFDGDLDFANEQSFGVRGTAAIYPFGAPLLWLPFYAAGDAWLAVLNLLGADHPRDGYFNAYQRAVGMGSLFYGWVGLLLLTRFTTAWVGRGLAAAATIVTVAGSFLAWYFVVDPSLPHVVSMAAVALYVWLWHSSGRGRDRREWARLGATAGLMSLVRWQNVGFGLLAFVDWTGRLVVALRARDRRAALQVVTDGVAFGTAFLVVFSPQLAFWRVTRGGWLDAPTGEHAVSWTGPLRDVLFTPDHGLFTSSPLLALAMLGFLLLLPRAPRVAGLLAVAFAFQVYVLGTVGSPGYGFGTRRLASCAVLFVPGLALFVDAARRRPMAVPAGLLAVLIGFNLLFMLDVR